MDVTVAVQSARGVSNVGRTQQEAHGPIADVWLELCSRPFLLPIIISAIYQRWRKLYFRHCFVKSMPEAFREGIERNMDA